jgi:tetratricopeptide (TPR) repeat protein
MASSLATLLRNWRERALLSQEQLAVRTGLGVRTIRRLEADGTRRPHGASVRRLADALDLTEAERQELSTAARRESPAVAHPDAATRPGGNAPGPIGPRQLPADVPGFVGRTEQLGQLDALLDVQGSATTAVISAIAGTAGVGKTALALHWAHRASDRFPDGQLYVNLRGYDPTGSPMMPGEAVRLFLDAFGLPPERMPASLGAQAALYRSLLAGRRVLVVLDNAHDPEQVRPLLPGTPGCLALVTSRNQLTGLIAADGAQPITLDVLAPAEARDLLARRLGGERVGTEPAATDQLIAACARLPLALAIVAARAAAQPTFPLAALAADLADADRRLDALDTGEAATQLRAVFSWSYHRLNPATARLFRLLGLHCGPDISAPAAASLVGEPRPTVRRALDELTRAQLLVEHAPGRYTFHDLLRAYAAERAHATDPADQRRAAAHRMLDHYLHGAHTADRQLDPHRDPIELAAPLPGTIPEAPADHAQALAWLSAEHAVLLAAIDYAAANGWDTHAWQLAWAVANFLDRRGHWHDWVAAQRVAVAAAARLADPPAQACTHRLLARAQTELGRFADARAHFQQALDLSVQTGDVAGQAHNYRSLARVLAREGNYLQALDHARRALSLYQVAGHRRGQANAFNAVGWYHALLGDHQRALTSCQQALLLHQDLGTREGEASTWDSLGFAHHHLGHHTQAITCFQQALDLYVDLGDRYYEAETLNHIGDTHHAAGNATDARTAWRRTLTILEEIHHADADLVRTKLADLDHASGPVSPGRAGPGGDEDHVLPVTPWPGGTASA